MNAKNLQKATLILKEIHELDSQLIKLDKKAMAIANGEEHLSIKLSFDKEKKQSETGIDAETMHDMYSFMISPWRAATPKLNIDSEKFNFNLSDKECLFVIGALISAKKECRRSLCEKIIALGVEV